MNTTPQGEDDGEETDLQRLAVTSRAKEESKLLQDKTIQQRLGSTTNDHAKDTSDTTPTLRRTRFPNYIEYQTQDEKADSLPDVIHFSFEDTTTDVILQGYEDAWVSDAHFDVQKWGKLQEPKIDFIYTC